jgi:hypothetical protein
MHARTTTAPMKEQADDLTTVATVLIAERMA